MQRMYDPLMAEGVEDAAQREGRYSYKLGLHILS